MVKCSVICAAVLAMMPQGQPAVSRAESLRRLVETERRFARAATEKGIRDSFLEFFAADSLALVPDPQPAVPRLRARPSQSFADAELTWEPRAGDVAAAGDLGWLTGPSTYIDHAAGAAASYGNYLSIWQRRPDGQWRVYIDIGTTTPQSVSFAEGFSTVRPPRPWTRGSDRRAGASFAAAERTLNARILAVGMARAYESAVVPEGSRLHRQDAMPQVGRAAIVAWLETQGTRWAPRTLAAEIAGSGDLAYSYGTYTAGGNRGGYVRVWARDDAGRWWLMADVATPEQPASGSK
jgi:ketosteroid isomerase-like protein